MVPLGTMLSIPGAAPVFLGVRLTVTAWIGQEVCVLATLSVCRNIPLESGSPLGAQRVVSIGQWQLRLVLTAVALAVVVEESVVTRSTLNVIVATALFV